MTSLQNFVEFYKNADADIRAGLESWMADIVKSGDVDPLPDSVMKEAEARFLENNKTYASEKDVDKALGRQLNA